MIRVPLHPEALMSARRSPLVWSVVALAVGAACSDSSGSVGPTALAIVSGNGQTGNLNAALAQPLVVRVSGDGGASFPGATVNWAVSAGSATLGSATSQTDTGGRASITVTMGSAAGAVSVTASTGSLTPVTFALTAVGPAVLSVVSGDGQTGPVGGELLEPLRVAVTGTDGQPYVGGSVAWSVTAGAASLNPITAVTNPSGEATTVVSPAAAGALTVSASAGAATPAAFAATAVPACEYVRPYVLGDVVNGILTTLDCGLNLGAIFYYDFYQLDFASQQSFSIGMSSGSFDTWLDVFKATGELLGSNDDSLGVVTNSYFEGIFAAGNYVFGASSYDPVVTGPYTVRSAVRAATISQCRVIWGTQAITVGETIETTDCVDNTTGSNYYSDRMVFALSAGDNLEVHMASGDVDPYLYLVDLASGTIVASNDDSTLGNPTAYFVYAVPQDGFYFIDIGTAIAGQTGTYTLTIGGSVVAGAAATRRVGPIPTRGTGAKSPISIRTPLRNLLGVGKGGGSP